MYISDDPWKHGAAAELYEAILIGAIDLVAEEPNESPKREEEAPRAEETARVGVGAGKLLKVSSAVSRTVWKTLPP